MAPVTRLHQPPDGIAAPGGYVETETARDITRSLDLVMQSGGVTMIAGRSGVGKSTALDRFCAGLPEHTGGEALRLTITSGQGSPWHVATGLMRPWGISPRSQAGGLETAFDFLSEQLLDESYRERCFTFIMVDEAQYLDHRTRKSHYRGAGFEWLRSLSEHTRIPLCFAGDLALIDGVGLFPQLKSRMHRPVIIREATQGDVDAVAASYGVTGDLERHVLAAVAKRDGALRNVSRVLDTAWGFAGGETPHGDHIKAAIFDLKLDPKGGFK